MARMHDRQVQGHRPPRRRESAMIVSCVVGLAAVVTLIGAVSQGPSTEDRVISVAQAAR